MMGFTFSPWFLGLYVVIGALSACAAYYLIRYVVVPAMRGKNLKESVGRYLFGIGAAVAMIAHFFENALYGLGRWIPEYRVLLTDQWLAATGKVLIVVSTLVTMAAVVRARSGDRRDPQYGRIALVALSVYIGGVWLAMAAQALQ